MPVENDPFDMTAFLNATAPGYRSVEADEGTSSVSDQSRGQKEKDRSETESRARANTQEAISVKSRLNPNQNNNNAKNNPLGNLNNRSFGKTLALSRAADRYNNKPISPIVNVNLGKAGAPGTTTSHEKPYERLEITTEETRQMERARRIDEARLMLRNELQGKVDQWTYDRYRDFFEQLAAYNMSHDQFMNMINQYVTQANVSQYLAKDIGRYNTLLRQYGIMLNAQSLLKVSQKSTAVAAMVAQMFGIDTMIRPEEVFTEQNRRNAFIDLKKQFPNMSDDEAWTTVKQLEQGYVMSQAEKI